MKWTIGIAVFLAAAAAMAQDVIQGSYSYTYGDSESLVEARQVCKDLALREAIESYHLLIESSTKVENYQLKEDVIQSITAGYLQEIKILTQTEEGRTISTTVEAKVVPADIQKLIDQKWSSSTNPVSVDSAGRGSSAVVPKAATTERFLTVVGDFETTCNRSRGYAHQGEERRAAETMNQLKTRLNSRKPTPDQELQMAFYQAMQDNIALFFEWNHAYQLKGQRKTVRAKRNTGLLRQRLNQLGASSQKLRKMESLSDTQAKARERCLKECDKMYLNSRQLLQSIKR